MFRHTFLEASASAARDNPSRGGLGLAGGGGERVGGKSVVPVETDAALVEMDDPDARSPVDDAFFLRAARVFVETDRKKSTSRLTLPAPTRLDDDEDDESFRRVALVSPPVRCAAFAAARWWTAADIELGKKVEKEAQPRKRKQDTHKSNGSNPKYFTRFRVSALTV